jgi:ribosomal protein S4E
MTFGGTAAPTSTVDINGSFAAATVAKTGAYTAAIGDHVITCDASGGAFTVTLPAASGVAGRIYHIKKTDSSGNAVTVDGNSSETIDDALTQVINVQYDSMMIICTGSEWFIV